LYINPLPPIAFYNSTCISARKMSRMSANVVQKLDGFDNAVVRMLYKQIQLVIKV
jgi:hypothetical protein